MIFCPRTIMCFFHQLCEDIRLQRAFGVRCPFLLRRLNSPYVGRFLIDKVREIEWDDHAIGRLVLPSGYKETILSLARSQYRSIQDSSQMIQGKGTDEIACLTRLTNSYFRSWPYYATHWRTGDRKVIHCRVRCAIISYSQVSVSVD